MVICVERNKSIISTTDRVKMPYLKEREVALVGHRQSLADSVELGTVVKAGFKPGFSACKSDPLTAGPGSLLEFSFLVNTRPQVKKMLTLVTQSPCGIFRWC